MREVFRGMLRAIVCTPFVPMLVEYDETGSAENRPKRIL